VSWFQQLRDDRRRASPRIVSLSTIEQNQGGADVDGDSSEMCEGLHGAGFDYILLSLLNRSNAD
jgi:hypothetical protein